MQQAARPFEEVFGSLVEHADIRYVDMRPSDFNVHFTIGLDLTVRPKIHESESPALYRFENLISIAPPELGDWYLVPVKSAASTSYQLMWYAGEWDQKGVLLFSYYYSASPPVLVRGAVKDDALPFDYRLSRLEACRRVACLSRASVALECPGGYAVDAAPTRFCFRFSRRSRRVDNVAFAAKSGALADVAEQVRAYDDGLRAEHARVVAAKDREHALALEAKDRELDALRVEHALALEANDRELDALRAEHALALQTKDSELSALRDEAARLQNEVQLSEASLRDAKNEMFELDKAHSVFWGRYMRLSERLNSESSQSFQSGELSSRVDQINGAMKELKSILESMQEFLSCPVALEPFVDPVVGAYDSNVEAGIPLHVYERSWLMRHIERNGLNCPVSKTEFQFSVAMRTVHPLRRLCEHWPDFTKAFDALDGALDLLAKTVSVGST